MSPRLSSFLAGVLVGIALTAGIAAMVIRTSDLQQRAQAAPEQATASGEAPAHRQLRLAHGLSREHPVHAGLTRFAELVAQYSGGQLSVQIFPNGELGSETETLEQIQAGTLDLAKASAAPLESFAPEFGALSVPYAFRGSEHYWNVLNGEIGEEVLAAAVDKGMRGLCYYDAGARSFYTPDKPIMSPADVKGLKVRVMQSQTAMDMITTFGGSPTPMAYGELYSALQSGLVDAAENNPPCFYRDRHFEVCKQFSLNEHARIPDVLLMSEHTWSQLTPEQREWVKTAARESVHLERELWQKSTQAALEAVQKQGVTIHYPDQLLFAKAVEPMHERYRGTLIGDLLDRIKAMPGN